MIMAMSVAKETSGFQGRGHEAQNVDRQFN